MSAETSQQHDMRDRMSRVEGILDSHEKRFRVIEDDVTDVSNKVSILIEDFSRFRGAAGSDLAVARTQLDKLEPITEDQMKTLAHTLSTITPVQIETFANMLNTFARWGRRGIVALVLTVFSSGGLGVLLEKLLS